MHVLYPYRTTNHSTELGILLVDGEQIEPTLALVRTLAKQVTLIFYLFLTRERTRRSSIAGTSFRNYLFWSAFRTSPHHKEMSKIEANSRVTKITIPAKM